MERVESIKIAEEHLLNEVQTCIVRIRDLLEHDVSSIGEGVATLRRLRQEVYEDLNQVMHEALILSAARWLEANVFQVIKTIWYWNPRQTGDSAEPDLRGVVNGKIVVSAEATASEEPKGVIDTRMRDTLTKLNDMPGKRYYFVPTEKMAQRARTKVSNNHYDIQVVII